jgi:hypothetical protein
MAAGFAVDDAVRRRLSQSSRVLTAAEVERGLNLLPEQRLRQLMQEGAKSEQAVKAEQRAQTTLLRCIFGNPFRPVAFDPRWRTADVLGLARGIYEDRAFERLPLLADALMDAGCADEQVIGHCRSEGPHVRGCWVVDLVLDKE